MTCLNCDANALGPRPELHFKPSSVRGAIVTCGGLCPGLNSVIHHIVTTLLLTYKADKVRQNAIYILTIAISRRTAAAFRYNTAVFPHHTLNEGVWY